MVLWVQAPAPLSILLAGHVHVPPIKEDPDKMLSQSLQAPAPLSILSTGHTHVSASPSPSTSAREDPDKMLSQSLQAPAPLLISPGGQTQVFPTKDDPIKIVAQSGTQAPASPLISPFGHVQVSPSVLSKVDPVRRLAQSSTHLFPPGPDPGRPVKSKI